MSATLPAFPVLVIDANLAVWAVLPILSAVDVVDRLAEELGAELWTADRRLVNGAHQAGVIWARWIGERTSGP